MSHQCNFSRNAKASPQGCKAQKQVLKVAHKTPTTTKAQKMKTKIKTEQISIHASGNYPVRELEANERDEHMTIVAIPCGFEPLFVAIYGHRICDDDCIDAAFDALRNSNPHWMDWDDCCALADKKDSSWIAN